MFNKKIIIITPWFGNFAGGAEVLAKNLAINFIARGIETIVFTTCSKSPYDSWWEDYHDEGVDKTYGVTTHRFATNKTKGRYENAIIKTVRGEDLNDQEKEDYFVCGINSDNLVIALKPYIDKGYEVMALPYFQGLTHSVINSYPNKVSLIGCFHNEPQFYWDNIATLISNSKHIFFNTEDEKSMTIKTYGLKVGRKIIESPVVGVGVELEDLNEVNNEFTDKLPKDYFVYLGRKEKGKNVHKLCEWFELYLKRYNKNTKLVFLGGGDVSLLPKNDNFIDYGFVSEADKCATISKSKGVINLSNNESFSIVLIESWLLEVPVIVSDNCAPTKGHVMRSNGGLCVNNSAEFILSLKYLEENEPISKKIALNGKRYASNEYSFDNVLSKYLACLSN